MPLLTGHAVPKWDAADLFEPMFAMVGDAARSGQILKWDPWSGAGTPDWAQPEFGTTSPVLLAFSLLPINPLHAYIAYWLSVWFFGALGMLLLARHTGCSPPAAVIVACGFAASGFFTGHAEHMSSLYSVAYLPWILWRFDAGLKRRDWWCGVQAGVLYGLSALGGYPEFTILTPGFLTLWATARFLAADRAQRRRTGIAAVVVLGVAIVTGALILAPPYAGLILHTRGYTDYIGPRPRDVALSSNLLPAAALSTLASPALAELNRPPNPIWPETDIAMTSIYMGSATVVLAIAALRRKRWRWLVASIAVFFFCCALGSQLPLRGWLYDLAPPTRYFRNPSLFRAYVILVAGVVAAMGARDLAQSAAEFSVRLWRIAAVLAVGAAAAFVIVIRVGAKSLSEPRIALAHLCVAWFGLACLSFLLKSGRILPGRFLHAAAALACLDAFGALSLSRNTIWDDASPALEAVNAAHQTGLTLASLDRSLLPASWLGRITNRSLLLKAAVFDDYTSHQIFRNRFQREILADPVLSSVATGSNRTWFSAAPLWLAPDDSSFQRFQSSVRRQGPMLVLHQPSQMLGLVREDSSKPGSTEPLVAGEGAVPATVTNLIYQPDLISFRYDAPEAGYLLVTDRWAEGWEASVNGQPRPVFGADFIYRAVAVEAGGNAVQFVYRPSWFRLLLGLSWGTLLLGALGQVFRLCAPR